MINFTVQILYLKFTLEIINGGHGLGLLKIGSVMLTIKKKKKNYYGPRKHHIIKIKFMHQIRRCNIEREREACHIIII